MLLIAICQLQHVRTSCIATGEPHFDSGVRIIAINKDCSLRKPSLKAAVHAPKDRIRYCGDEAVRTQIV